MPDRDPPVGRRRPGELEKAVLGVLVTGEQPLTPGDVRDRLAPAAPLSYSTIVTILTRMFTKGLVARSRDGRAFRYAPLTDGAGITARRMSELLDGAADHATVLRRFVGGLEPGDEELLRRLLADTDRRDDT